MRRTTGWFGSVLIALISSTAPAWAAPEAKSAGKVSEWLRWTIPLPKEVKLEHQVTLPAADVSIVLRGGASELERHAARTLRDLFQEKAGVRGETGKGFEILLGVCDAQGRIGEARVPDAARLRELPNGNQAYLIRAVGTNKLILAATDARGLFYAALTLRQLLEPKFSGASVTLPLAEITDWPDMAERGEWGCSSSRDIEWLAERKMNLVEFHTKHEVDEKGVSVVSINRSLLRRGQLNAVNMVPIISHLNSMGRRGVYKVYPEVRGKGKRALYKAHSSELWAPCASNPKLHEIMAGWMKGYAEYGVRDISCWLGELKQRCECEECAKVGQFALETRAFVKAWQIARKECPDLRIRILLTQGSYKTNEQVLAEVPAEVGVTYYDGGKTYDSSRDPMIYPLLEEYAAQGGWLGCYPQLTPSWRIVSPWSCPQFVKARMTEFVDKKVVSLGGYVVPDNRLFDFNVTAAAEWSWNAHGRDEREFALAWATRKRFSHPETIADWAVMLGPVSWDIYGARLVERYFFRPNTIESMVSARAKPAFGQGLFRYIPDADHLARNLQTCREALRLADRIGSAGIKAESMTVLTYYDMLDQLCRMCDQLAEHPTPDTAQRGALQDTMNRLALSGALNVEALRDWERAVKVGVGSGRFRECVQATEDTVQAVARALKPIGIRDPTPFLMSQKIGGWQSKDFQEKAEVVKTIDVTANILGPGAYTVTFQYKGGWNGLTSQRVALVKMPKGEQGEQVEISVDEHYGSTGHRSKGNVYALKLGAYDPGGRYLLVAKIRGTRPQEQKTGRTGCSGVVYFQRERDPDWQVRLMNVQPLSETEAGTTLRTKFSGKGIRVGVLIGGYGSEGILKLLKDSKGIDALPMGIGDPRREKCQVIILTQFKSGMIPAGFSDKMTDFIKRGGGVIATHDAVGYRAMPNVCPAVCAGGIDHVRHESWKVTTEHPVTKGLPRDTVLTQTYYDYIQLKPGPKGVVVALSETTKQPVAVAGSSGKGRYVAFGLLPGFSGDNQEIKPTTDESMFLLNAVKWCATSGGKKSR
ncbi:MAG: hypothetical protein KAI66_03195 [Lentisphaeria bacterium]|nr:hypothetical protein [Lentisphaeria bacterium]